MRTESGNFMAHVNPLHFFKSMQSANVQKVRKGEIIYELNDLADQVYFVQKGRVKIINYSKQGKEITRAIYGESEFFGELGLVGVTQRRGFALAMEESTVMLINIEEMKQKMKQQPGLQMYILKIIGSRVIEMEGRLESLTFNNSRSRIIEYLLFLAEKKGQRVGYEMLVRQFLTHQEIANMTATSRQTVTMILNELRNDKVLTFNRRRLLIRDMDKLRAEVRA